MENQLDKGAVDLAKAIRRNESGDNFQARGKSGEFGAYQFMPETWKEWSRKYLGQDIPLEQSTSEQQNEVAYKKIKELKDSGYNVGQIASIWNSGNPQWEGKKGVNAKGVEYDVPLYVNKISNTYQEIKGGQTSPQNIQTNVSVPTGGIDTSSLQQEAKNQPISQYEANQYQEQEKQPGLVQSLVQGISNPFLRTYETAKGAAGGLFGGLGMAIGGIGSVLGIPGSQDAVKKAIGFANESTEGTPRDYGYFGKIAPLGYTKEGKRMEDNQTYMDVAGNALDIGSTVLGGGGVVGAGKQGIKQGLIQGLKQGAKTGFVTGAVGGAGRELTNQADQGEFNPLELATQTGISGVAGGVGGGLIGGATGTAGSILNKFSVPRIIENRMEALDKIASRNTPVRNFINKQKEKGIDVKDILSKTDLLQGSVDNSGAIRTGNAIKELNDFIKPQEDVISNNLLQEGKTISLKEVKDKMIEALNNSNIKGGAKTTALKNINREINGLKLDADANGNIPLAIIHDAKVNKYSTINYLNPTVKQSDKMIAKTLKEIVEKNTKSIDVKKLNDELSKHYATLGFLEKLDGKIVEGGKLSKYFAQMLGAGVGSHFGPLGTIVGGEVAKGAQGKIMQGTFGRKTGQGLIQSPEMQKAISQSKNFGNRNIIQSKTITPVNKPIISNSIKPKEKNVNSSFAEYLKITKNRKSPLLKTEKIAKKMK